MSPATQRSGRRLAESATEMTQLVLPQHANVHGSVLGGTVMHWIDLAAAVVANRHCRRPVVTAAIDEMSFLAPILIGQLALLRARITLEKPPAGVRPNMLANIGLLGEPVEDVIHIPRSALIRGGGADRVVVALGEGRFAARPVVAGPESGDRVTILDGLAAGERVVVAAQFLLDSETNLAAGMDRLQNGAASPADKARTAVSAPHAEH